MKRILAGLVVVGLAGCVPGPAPEDEVATVAAREGYPLETLDWVQQGRHVEFDGRTWEPIGRPVHEPMTNLRRVGEFEGMSLFSPARESSPYKHLFFPIGNELWQALEPVGEAPAAEVEEPDTLPPPAN
jgi:hypothetical protein